MAPNYNQWKIQGGNYLWCDRCAALLLDGQTVIEHEKGVFCSKRCAQVPDSSRPENDLTWVRPDSTGE